MTQRSRRVEAKRDIVEEGTMPTDSCLLLEGMAARYSVLDDGRRQITAVHVAGDFVDLHNLLLARMDHSVLALGDCTVAMVSHDFLRSLTTTHPHLTRLLWFCTVLDAAIHRQWLIASGRLSSVGQVAHFLCEMFTRLSVVELTEGFSFRLPLNQSELSDAMGLSVVHVNRTLQELRKRGLIRWHGDQVEILDWPGLVALAHFDPTYLNLESRPR
ncbi:MAG: Crp/Fnr family transcriptional regulator [Rhizobiaceae bacterium]|nr:Crp/Fnr family transcriptional regulator [Rhizobiaceae bacterium]MCV0406057.1 Crp/Fnr family transcriptional regulator [Rhizobiaceae bacterium]